MTKLTAPAITCAVSDFQQAPPRNNPVLLLLPQLGRLVCHHQNPPDPGHGVCGLHVRLPLPVVFLRLSKCWADLAHVGLDHQLQPFYP
jgi:hypothetical protein